MFPSLTRRAVKRGGLEWRRLLHMWRTGNKTQTTALNKVIPHEVSSLSLGVGFIAAYSPFKHSHVYLDYYDCRLGTTTTGVSMSGPDGKWHCWDIGAPVKQVSCGMGHMITIATTGEAFATGSNVFRQCGQPSSVSHKEWCPLERITHVPPPIRQAACGLDHSLLLVGDGTVWSCGWSADGQTGTGACVASTAISQVSFPNSCHDDRVIQISAGGDTSFALTDDGEVYGWGNNEYGQLGEATPTDQVCTPIAINCSRFDGPVVTIATGGAFTGFLTSEGSVYMTGYSIEEPTQSHSRETGKVLPLSAMCAPRQLIDGRSSNRATSLHAGLNYLIAHMSTGDDVILWGKIPGLERKSECKHQLTNSDMISYACGPSELAVLLR